LSVPLPYSSLVVHHFMLLAEIHVFCMVVARSRCPVFTTRRGDKARRFVWCNSYPLNVRFERALEQHDGSPATQKVSCPRGFGYSWGFTGGDADALARWSRCCCYPCLIIFLFPSERLVFWCLMRCTRSPLCSHMLVRLCCRFPSPCALPSFHFLALSISTPKKFSGPKVHRGSPFRQNKGLSGVKCGRE